MTSQIEQRAAKYNASDPFEADELDTSRTEAAKRRNMLIAKAGAVMAGLTLLFPQGRAAVMNLFHPEGDTGAAPTLTQLAEHNRSVLSITADPNHPNLDRVVYEYRAHHASQSDIVHELAPGQGSDAGEWDLNTYTSADGSGDKTLAVSIGDTATFDMNPATGEIVPNPDK